MVTPAISKTLPTLPPGLIPQDGALYLGEYQGGKVIFYRDKSNTELQSWLESDVSPGNEMYAGGRSDLDGTTSGLSYPFDFRDLQNPHLLAQVNDQY